MDSGKGGKGQTGQYRKYSRKRLGGPGGREGEGAGLRFEEEGRKMILKS